jgi:hypothetical protein
VSAPNSTHSQNVNVLISDGHKLVREGITMLLQEKDARIRVVGEAQDAHSVHPADRTVERARRVAAHAGGTRGANRRVERSGPGAGGGARHRRGAAVG